MDMADNDTDFQLEWIKHHAVSLESKFEGFDEKPAHKNPVSKHLKKILTAKKRKISEETVDEELDLHGLTIDQGVAEAELFIEMAGQYNLNSVRIVHGLGPDNGPSIRSEVIRFLKTKGKGKISGYKIEPHNQGAVIVYPKRGG